VTSPAPSGLALLVVRVDGGSLPVVVGSTGFGTSGAIVLPPDALVVIPGQGESSVRRLSSFRRARPQRRSATCWGCGSRTMPRSRPIVSRRSRTRSGVQIGGDLVDGRGLANMFGPRRPDVVGLQIVMEALQSAGVAWSPADLADADHPGAVIRTLGAASGAEVVRLEAEEVASGVLRATPNQVSRALVAAFSGRRRRPSRSSC
jgi:hypothetical protein